MKDQPISVAIAEDRSNNPNFRGGHSGGPRGGRGGGFASRGFAAAGLTARNRTASGGVSTVNAGAGGEKKSEGPAE